MFQFILEVMLNDPRKAIEPRPTTSNRQETHINIRLRPQKRHHAPNTQDTPDILRVGHDSERKPFIPRNRLPQADSVVDTFLAQGLVDAHVEDLSRAKGGSTHNQAEGSHSFDLERREESDAPCDEGPQLDEF